MRRAMWFGLVIGLLLFSAGRAETKGPTKTRGPRFDAVTFGIRHRVFHDFRDLQRVKLNQDFILGDTEFSARVVQYVPDFQMDLERHKIFSLSDQPRNPAFKIIVRKGKVPQDTTWAFLKSPPHFGARSYFAFMVLRIDYLDRAPLLPDTTASAPAAMPHAAPPAAPPDSGGRR